MLKLNRDYTRVRSKPSKETSELAFEVGCHGKRRRKRSKPSLSSLQLQRIAKLVLEEGLTQVETAELCNVKPALVCKLIKTVRLANHSYASITEKRDVKEQKHDKLVQAVKEFLEQGMHVWTAQQVRVHLQKSKGLDYPLWHVRSVLHNDFNMRYRVLKKVPFQGNSERCLVMRMHYAKKMLELMKQGVRVIKIDETWLPHLDFRNKKWRLRGEQNTVSYKALSHRVNMIAALDTEG